MAALGKINANTVLPPVMSSAIDPTMDAPQLTDMVMPSAMPSAPAVSPVALPPIDPNDEHMDFLRADLAKRQNHVAPTTALGKIGHVAANIGNVLGDIFAPSTMALIPGTDLNNKVEASKDIAGINNASALKTAEAQREQTQALTDYTQQRPDIERSKVLKGLVTSLAPKGIIPTMNDDGTIDVHDDPNSQAYKNQQALQAMHSATAERDQIQGQIAQNHFVPGTPEYAEAQRKLAQVDRRLDQTLATIGLSRERLGLAKETLAFNEDKNYNPEPTSTEKTKGDLAQSAMDRIAEMKAIVARHPETFGPGAGRLQNATNWLGSSDPDAATYQAAAQYLADHSAGVFGGRGQYIMSQLHSLTDPKYNPGALNATLDEAERASQGFAKAGAVHAKGVQGNASASSIIYARDPQGNLHQAPAGTALPKGWKQEKR